MWIAACIFGSLLVIIVVFFLLWYKHHYEIHRKSRDPITSVIVSVLLAIFVSYQFLSALIPIPCILDYWILHILICVTTELFTFRMVKLLITNFIEELETDADRATQEPRVCDLPVFRNLTWETACGTHVDTECTSKRLSITEPREPSNDAIAKSLSGNCVSQNNSQEHCKYQPRKHMLSNTEPCRHAQTSNECKSTVPYEAHDVTISVSLPQYNKDTVCCGHWWVCHKRFLVTPYTTIILSTFMLLYVVIGVIMTLKDPTLLTFSLTCQVEAAVFQRGVVTASVVAFNVWIYALLTTMLKKHRMENSLYLVVFVTCLLLFFFGVYYTVPPALLNILELGPIIVTFSIAMVKPVLKALRTEDDTKLTLAIPIDPILEMVPTKKELAHFMDVTMYCKQKFYRQELDNTDFNNLLLSAQSSPLFSEQVKEAIQLILHESPQSANQVDEFLPERAALADEQIASLLLLIELDLLAKLQNTGDFM